MKSSRIIISLSSVKAIERVCGLGSALAKRIVDVNLCCLSMVVILDVLNQVSKSCAVFHRRNLFAVNSVCIYSALAGNLLLTRLSGQLGFNITAAIFVLKEGLNVISTVVLASVRQGLSHVIRTLLVGLESKSLFKNGVVNLTILNS